jgi:hypothetical protein
MDFSQMAEDLKVKRGDFITIKKWRSHKDRSWVGDCLRVGAVQENFLVCTKIIPGGKEGIRFTLNIDDVEIMPLNEDFIAEFLRA